MEISVKDFRELLQKYDDDLPISFSGLDFYRLKDRGGAPD